MPKFLDLMERERVTVAPGVPTIWFGVLDALEKFPGRWKFSWPVRLLVGGAAASESLMRGFDRHGFTVVCSWGHDGNDADRHPSLLRPYMNNWSEEGNTLSA